MHKMFWWVSKKIRVKINHRWPRCKSDKHRSRQRLGQGCIILQEIINRNTSHIVTVTGPCPGSNYNQQNMRQCQGLGQVEFGMMILDAVCKRIRLAQQQQESSFVRQQPIHSHSYHPVIRWHNLHSAHRRWLDTKKYWRIISNVMWANNWQFSKMFANSAINA